MKRLPSTQEPLKFQKRCALCNHVREKALFDYQNLWSPTQACDLCIRKAERVKQGLHTPDNSKVGAVREARRRPAATKAAEIEMLKDWKSTRRAQLTNEGILYGDAAAALAAEEPNARIMLGIKLI